MARKTFIIKGHLGSLPEDTTWWNDKDWEEWRANKEKLIKEGRFGEEFSVPVALHELDSFTTKNKEDNYKFNRCGFIIPGGGEKDLTIKRK